MVSPKAIPNQKLPASHPACTVATAAIAMPTLDSSASVGLHGMGREQAIGNRLRVYYNEGGTSVPYGGLVESFDMKRGLRVSSVFPRR